MLSLMIKKRYLNEKLIEQEATGGFNERREYKPFWRTRIGSVHAWGDGDKAVFLCGRHAFRADIMGIALDETPVGIEEVVPGDLCYNIECKFLQEELAEVSIFLSDVV